MSPAACARGPGGGTARDGTARGGMAGGPSGTGPPRGAGPVAEKMKRYFMVI